MAFTVEYLSSLPRKELQALAKNHGLKANKTSTELIGLLLRSDGEIPALDLEKTEEEADAKVEAKWDEQEVAIEKDEGQMTEEATVINAEQNQESESTDQVSTVPADFGEGVPLPPTRTIEQVVVQMEAEGACEETPVAEDVREEAPVAENEENDGSRQVSSIPLDSDEDNRSSSKSIITDVIGKLIPRQSTSAKIKGLLGVATLNALTNPPAIVPRPNKAVLLRQEALKKTVTKPDAVVSAAKSTAKLSQSNNTFTAHSGPLSRSASKPVVTTATSSNASTVKATTPFKAKPMPNFKALHTKCTVRPATTSSLALPSAGTNKENSTNRPSSLKTAGGKLLPTKSTAVGVHVDAKHVGRVKTALVSSKEKRNESIAAARQIV